MTAAERTEYAEIDRRYGAGFLRFTNNKVALRWRALREKAERDAGNNKSVLKK